jgi:hypothetical protein
MVSDASFRPLVDAIGVRDIGANFGRPVSPVSVVVVVVPVPVVLVVAPVSVVVVVVPVPVVLVVAPVSVVVVVVPVPVVLVVAPVSVVVVVVPVPVVLVVVPVPVVLVVAPVSVVVVVVGAVAFVSDSMDKSSTPRWKIVSDVALITVAVMTNVTSRSATKLYVSTSPKKVPSASWPHAAIEPETIVFPHGAILIGSAVRLLVASETSAWLAGGTVTVPTIRSLLMSDSGAGHAVRRASDATILSRLLFIRILLGQPG